MVKNLPAMWETRVQSLGWEDPLEKGMVTHSSLPPKGDLQYFKGLEHGMMEVWRETQGSRSKRRGGEGDVSPQAATRPVLLPTQISAQAACSPGRPRESGSQSKSIRGTFMRL